MKNRTCVIREVKGIRQFIPIEDAVIVPGENIYHGLFGTDSVKDGPSDSHERTICLPQGEPRSLPLTCCHMGNVAPGRDWQSLSEPIRYQNNERVFVTHRQYLDLVGAA
ncbi:MAG: hypothetical protein K2X27_22845 [Candidatus Obscuribacterales bacterium]|nr:hypothetical protein [Candidatus Obscuribacterales bacterium]